MKKPISLKPSCQSPVIPYQDPSLLPWWEPERITLFREGGWETLQGWDLANVVKLGTVGVSPIGLDGKAHFIAWDIDSGEEKHVQALLRALPEGVRPLVSWSGKKGWHIWIFPDEPLPPEEAVDFAKAIRKEAGLDRKACEIFPQSKRSKCLKWPGQKHHETGEIEVFVPPDSLHDRERYDTVAILQALRDGLRSTPSILILDWLAKNAVSPRVPSQPRRKRRREGSPDLASCEELARYLLVSAGREPVPLGKEFRCILPGHEEKRPSAAFWRMPDDRICYHDFHHEKYGIPEWLPLGVVYHALKTGEVVLLPPHETARALAELALNAGVVTPLAQQVSSTLDCNTELLVELEIISGNALEVMKCMLKPKQLEHLLEIYFQLFKLPSLDRVWVVFGWEAALSAQSGFREVKASVRYIAERAKVDKWIANRSLNLFAVLGLVAKVPHTGGHKGDRFTVLEADANEVKKRWDALGHPSLERFNRALVARCLGGRVARAVFRRGAEGSLCGIGCHDKREFPNDFDSHGEADG